MATETKIDHPEWEKLNSLTTPGDMPDKKVEFDLNAPPLSNDEMRNATEFLIKKDFRQIEKRYTDPLIYGQKIGLVSFVPARGATPNANGVYGFAKLRGNFATLPEADEKANEIIRNFDSYHTIYYTEVGKPFPLTTSHIYSQESKQIDMQKEAANALSDEVKKKREKEQKEIEEIQSREKELLEDVKKPEEETLDKYITLHVKKSQLTWTYVETMKKLKAMITLIAKAKKEVNDMDKKFPEYKTQHREKYFETRRKIGFPDDHQDETFIKYLVEDYAIPEVDQEYQLLYGNDE